MLQLFLLRKLPNNRSHKLPPNSQPAKKPNDSFLTQNNKKDMVLKDCN